MPKKSLKSPAKKPAYAEPSEAQLKKAFELAQADGHKYPASAYLGEAGYKGGGIRIPM